MLKNVLLFAFTAILARSAQQPVAPEIALIRVPHAGLQPQALRDSRGVIHLLYFSGNPEHGDLFYVKSAVNASTWSSPMRVNSQPGSAVVLGTIRGGQLALGKAGRIHVAWNGSNETLPTGPINGQLRQREAPMLYSRLNDSHSAFESERNLMTHTFGLDGGGSIAADTEGNVHVAWHGKTSGDPPGEAGRQVWVTTSHDEGKTFAVEHAAWKGSTGACGCCGLAISADAHGGVRVLYRSATGGVHRDIYLLTSADRARTFQGRKLQTWEINACPMSSMAFAESAGEVEGAWETAGQVSFANLRTTNPVPVRPPGENKRRKHPRIAIDQNGRTLMTWAEGTGWARGGSVAWQLYDAHGTLIGNAGSALGLPAWSFSAVLAKRDGFLVIY